MLFVCLEAIAHELPGSKVTSKPDEDFSVLVKKENFVHEFPDGTVKTVKKKAEDSLKETKIVRQNVDNVIMKAKVDEVKTHKDSANYCQDIPEHVDSAKYCHHIPEQPVDDPAFKDVIANVIDEITVVKLEKTQECTNVDQDIPDLSNNVLGLILIDFGHIHILKAFLKF